MRYSIENILSGKVAEYIKEKGFELPNSNLIIVAYDKDNNIIGVSAIQSINVIEPFICDNPIVANNLYQRTEALAQLANKEIYALTKSKDIDKLLSKLGYENLENYKLWRKKWD